MTAARAPQAFDPGARAVFGTTADGRRVRARRAVVADTSAPALYDRLLPASAVPAGLRRRLERFEWDLPTIKLNFRLSEPAPWRSEAARGAAVVHAGQSSRGLVRWAAAIDSGVLPERPFALVGQMSTVDPTRSPEGTEALWAYSHVPRESWADHEVVAAGIERVEEMLEGLAPGFREVVLDRWDQTPTSLQESDANLGQGGVGGGTQQLFQQAIFRPVTGLGGPRTHLAGLYLGSAAIHPGGGVHGGCGWLAANAALRDHRWWGRPVARAERGLLGRIHGGPVRLHTTGGPLEVDEVLVATGRTPRLTDLGLESVGITPEDARAGRLPDWLHLIGDAAGTARLLTHLRADEIVEDCEDLRRALGVERWSLLGQSFGGFIITRRMLHMFRKKA